MKTLTAATNSTASIGTASALILPANPRRSYAIISNGSAVGVWLSLGSPAAIGTGIYLAPGGGVFIIDEYGLYRGAIYGSAASGSGNVLGTVDLQ